MVRCSISGASVLILINDIPLKIIACLLYKSFGVISFVLLKLLAGKKEEITLTMAVLAVVFVGILISH